VNSGTIRRIMRRIVNEFHPHKIILFGSHARGTAARDSDVDLLVMMPVPGSKRAQAVEIATALHDIDIGKDIFVTTPEEFEWRRHVVGTVERAADREGKVLYARG
jgi:predicted nucleotidyltransferase